MPEEVTRTGLLPSHVKPFFLLGQFGLCECRHAFSLEEGIAGIPQKAGIAARFEAFLKENEKAPGANLLKEGYNYMLMEHAADPDTLIHEWAESVIGDQYPVPDRILHFTELIVQDYLAQEMCDRRPPKGTFDLFATEGGTAAMCYLFDSLQENFLLNQGGCHCFNDSSVHSLYRNPGTATLSVRRDRNFC